MKILIVTYFFLSIFSIFSSNYSFNFKQVESIPSSIQCYDYRKVYDQSEKNNNETLRSLNNHSVNWEKSDYCLDLQHSTGVCLEKLRDDLYKICFSDGGVACSPLASFEKKPLAIGVNKNIIVYLTLEGDFYMTIITPIIDKNTFKETYFANNPQQVKKMDFDQTVTNAIKNQSGLYKNSPVYCFPGNEGQFYFTYDVVNKTNTYLLTIEKNDYAKLKSSSIINKNDNLIADGGNKKASDTNETFFKKYLRFKFFLGLCLSFVIIWGIAKFLIVK